MGFINRMQLELLGLTMANNTYGQYLIRNAKN